MLIASYILHFIINHIQLITDSLILAFMGEYIWNVFCAQFFYVELDLENFW